MLQTALIHILPIDERGSMVVQQAHWRSTRKQLVFMSMFIAPSCHVHSLRWYSFDATTDLSQHYVMWSICQCGLKYMVIPIAFITSWNADPRILSTAGAVVRERSALLAAHGGVPCQR